MLVKLFEVFLSSHIEQQLHFHLTYGSIMFFSVYFMIYKTIMKIIRKLSDNKRKWNKCSLLLVLQKASWLMKACTHISHNDYWHLMVKHLLLHSENLHVKFLLFTFFVYELVSIQTLSYTYTYTVHLLISYFFHSRSQ